MAQMQELVFVMAYELSICLHDWPHQSIQIHFQEAMQQNHNIDSYTMASDVNFDLSEIRVNVVVLLMHLCLETNLKIVNANIVMIHTIL